MLSLMNGNRINVQSDGASSLESIVKDGVRNRPDVSALASTDGKRIYILSWHYHDDDVAGPVANLEVALNNLPFKSGPLRVREYRIDADHSNAFAVWQKMGSPATPSRSQYAQLEKAGQLALVSTERIQVKNSSARLSRVL
jgi:xylan 1,4-beta-xylosidase